MSTTNSILFLHVSRPEQLDAAVLLEARGYTVKTVVDAHQLLRENEFAFTARNIRWGTSHVMMMCHFNVLHPEMEAVDAIRTIAHARCLGAHCASGVPRPWTRCSTGTARPTPCWATA
jgi:hypothetical protein